MTNDSEKFTKVQMRTLLLLKQTELASGESDRGYVLFLAAQVDMFLREIIEAFLIEDPSVKNLFDGAYAPLGSLSGKTGMAFSLGLITDSERRSVEALRKVRNVFAHQVEATFEHPDITKICRRPPIAPSTMIDRDAFLHMAMNIIFPLAYRPAGVAANLKRTVLTLETANAWSTQLSANGEGSSG